MVFWGTIWESNDKVDVSFKRVFEQVQCAILSRRWCFLSRWSHFVEHLCNFVDSNVWCVKFLPPLVTYYGLLNKFQASTVRMVVTFSRVFREHFIIFCQNFGTIHLFFITFRGTFMQFSSISLSYVCFPLSFVTYYGPLRQVFVK